MSNPADKLQQIFASLGTVDQQSLLAFAEFLQQRGSGLLSPGSSVSLQQPAPEKQEPQMPDNIQRPSSESVIKAVKRLSATYHMLDKNALLNETSELVTQHVVLGRDKVEVIDELEVVFQNRYQEYLDKFSSEGEDQ